MVHCSKVCSVSVALAVSERVMAADAPWLSGDQNRVVASLVKALSPLFISQKQPEFINDFCQRLFAATADSTGQSLRGIHEARSNLLDCAIVKQQSVLAWDMGLPLCLTYSEVGHQVLGLDIDDSKVTSINNGKSYIHHIDSARIKKAKDANLLDATIDFSRASEIDALILCVPTPLNQYRGLI